MVCEALHKLSCLIYSFLISLRPHSVLWAIPWTNQAHSTLKSLQWLLPFPWMLFLDFLMAAAAVKSLQLCPTLCDPWTACSPPGSSVRGILQARILEWVAISFSRASSWPRDRTCISCTGRQILYPRAPPGLLHCRQTLYLLRLQGSHWVPREAQLDLLTDALGEQPQGTA